MDKDLSKIIRLQWITQLAPFEINVSGKYKTGKTRRIYPKLCYKKSWDYAIGHDNVKVCHGLYTQHQVGHAWVELPESIIFDGVMQRFYNKDGYYKTLKVTKLAEYTTKQAARLILKHRHFGPWDESS